MKSFFAIIALLICIHQGNSQTVTSASLSMSGNQIEVSVNNTNGPSAFNIDFEYLCGTGATGCHQLVWISGGGVGSMVMGSQIQIVNAPSQPFVVSLDYSLCSNCDATMNFKVGGQSWVPLEVASLSNAAGQFPNLNPIGVRDGTVSDVFFAFEVASNGNGLNKFAFTIDPLLDLDPLGGTDCFDAWDVLDDNWHYQVVDYMSVVSGQPFPVPSGGWCANGSGTPITVDNYNTPTSVIIDNNGNGLNAGDYLVFYNCSTVPCGETRQCGGQTEVLCAPEFQLDYRAGTLSICGITGMETCSENVSTTIEDVTQREVEIVRLSPVGGYPVDEFGFDCLGASPQPQILNWHYEIRNINPDGSVIRDVYIRLREGPEGSVTSVSEVVAFPNGPNITWVCPNAPPPLGGPPCNSDGGFIFHIDELDTNQPVTLTFNTQRCRTDAMVDNADYCSDIQFNQWRLEALSYCINTCITSANCTNNAAVNFNTCVPESTNAGANLLCVTSEFGVTNSGIGGNAVGGGPDFQFDLLPGLIPGSAFGDICFTNTRTPVNFQIQIAGNGHQQLGTNDEDVFDNSEPQTQHLVRARIILEDGLTLNTAPELVDPSNSGITFLPQRVVRRDLGTPTQCMDAAGIILVDCNTTDDMNNVQWCPSQFECDDQSCPLTCDGYGRVWDVYYVVENEANGGSAVSGMGTLVDLEFFMTSLFEFELLAACDCIDNTIQDNSLDMRVDFDFTSHVDGNGGNPLDCGLDVTTAAQVDLDALTWFRLRSIGKHDHQDVQDDDFCPSAAELNLNVQCPGCLAPGIIACNYRMQRTTFGEHDADDNGEVDDCNNIPTVRPNGAEDDYALHRSMHGDELEDEITGYFQDGDPTSVDLSNTLNWRNGYSYAELTTHAQDAIVDGGCGITGNPFQVLQLLRTFTGTNTPTIKNDMGLTITEVNLRVYRQGQGDNCSTNPVLGTEVVDKIWGANALDLTDVLQEDPNVPNDYLFTFKIGPDDPNDAAYLGNELNSGPQFEFMVNDLYVIECRYEVCGNILPRDRRPDQIPGNEALETMTVNNNMWFTHTPQSLGTWAVSGDNLITNTPALDCNLAPPTGTMIPAIPADCNAWENCIFFCETVLGYHYFVPIGTQMTFLTTNSAFGQLPCVADPMNPMHSCELDGCNRTFQMLARSFIGNGNDVDYFPFEIRVPPLELKHVNTTNLYPEHWTIIGVQTQTADDITCEWEPASLVSGATDCWDVNMNLNFLSTAACPEHMIEDGLNETFVRIIYKPDYIGGDACAVLNENDWYPGMDCPMPPCQPMNGDFTDEIMLFDYLDETLLGAHGLGTDCVPVNGPQCGGQENYANMYTGSGQDNGYLFEGLEDVSFSFNQPAQLDGPFSVFSWDFEPGAHSFQIQVPPAVGAPPEDNCLHNWEIKYDDGSGTPTVVASLMGSGGGTITVLDDGMRNNGLDAYTLCASLVDCSCTGANVDPVVFNVMVGNTCGCAPDDETCFAEVPLSYSGDEFLYSWTGAATATSPTCNDMPPAYDDITLQCILNVTSGSYYPQTVRIPVDANLLPTSGTVNVPGSPPAYCLNYTGVNIGNWVYELEDITCSGTPANVVVPLGTSLEFTLTFEALCAGTFELNPMLLGTDNCVSTITPTLNPPATVDVLSSPNCPPCTNPPLSCNLLANDLEPLTNQAIGYDHIAIGSEMLIVGSISDGAGVKNAYVVKTDGSTNPPSDSRNFGSANSIDSYSGVVRNGNEYIMTGSTSDGNGDIIVTELTQNFVWDWTKKHDFYKVQDNGNHNYSGSYVANDISAGLLPNTSIVVGEAPYVSPAGIIMPNPDALIVELDAMGEVNKILRMGQVNSIESGSSIITIPSRDEYVFVGRHEDLSRSTFKRAVHLQTIYNDGNDLQSDNKYLFEVLSNKRHLPRSIVFDEGATASPDDDRLYVAGSVLVSSGYWEAFVIAIDYKENAYNTASDISVAWAIRYALDGPPNPFTTHALDLVLNDNGDLIVAGLAKDGNGNHGYILEIETSQTTPSINWMKKTPVDRADAFFWSVESTGPSTYQLVGQSNEIPSGDRIIMLEVDLNAPDNCCLEDVLPLSQIHEVVTTNLSKSSISNIWEDRNLGVVTTSTSNQGLVNEDFDDVCQSQRSAAAFGASQNNSDAFAILLFPNPVSQLLTVSADIELQSFTIVDVLGKVYQTSNEITTGSQFQLDVGTLAPGLYNVIVKSVDGSIATEVFVKE